LGLPLVEARGRLDGRALRRLAGTLVRLLRESPRVIVLDVRQAGEAATAVPLLANLLQPQLQDACSQLWFVGPLDAAANGSLQLFPDLDSVLWKLAEIGER